MAKIIVQVGAFNGSGEFKPMSFNVVEYDYSASPDGKGTFRSLVVPATLRPHPASTRPHPLLLLLGEMPLDSQRMFPAKAFDAMMTLPCFRRGPDRAMPAWEDYAADGLVDPANGPHRFEELYRQQCTFEQMIDQGMRSILRTGGRKENLFVRVIMQAEQHDVVFKPYSAPTPRLAELGTMLHPASATRAMSVKDERYVVTYRDHGELPVTAIRKQESGEPVWLAGGDMPFPALLAFHVALAGLGMPEAAYA